jgi:SPP1 gp7 family putative phage head morphogenesis protein
MQADVKAVIGLAPADVIAYFQAKKFAITWDWHELLDEQHAQQFTVAKVTKLDVLQSISDALIKAAKQGQTFKQFSADLTPVLQSKGWWGKAVDPDTGEITPAHGGTTAPAQLGSARRLWTIYQTNMQSAFMAGRYKTMLAAVDTHPVWRYVAVLDRRTRPDHAALDGRMYRYDDVFWQYYYPPNGYLCRCRAVPVSAAALARESDALRSSDAEPITLRTVTVGGGDNVREAKQASFKSIHAGRPIIIRTDPGFAYNVGQAVWQPEANRWHGAVGALSQTILPGHAQ